MFCDSAFCREATAPFRFVRGLDSLLDQHQESRHFLALLRLPLLDLIVHQGDVALDFLDLLLRILSARATNPIAIATTSLSVI